MGPIAADPYHHPFPQGPITYPAHSRARICKSLSINGLCNLRLIMTVMLHSIICRYWPENADYGHIAMVMVR